MASGFWDSPCTAYSGWTLPTLVDMEEKGKMVLFGIPMSLNVAWMVMFASMPLALPSMGRFTERLWR